MMSAISSRASRGSSGPYPSTSLQMSSSRSSCSEDRHHDILDRDDLVDDVANFLARADRRRAWQADEVDGLDQRAEDGPLGLVVGIGTSVRCADGICCGAFSAGRHSVSSPAAPENGRSETCGGKRGTSTLGLSAAGAAAGGTEVGGGAGRGAAGSRSARAGAELPLGRLPNTNATPTQSDSHYYRCRSFSKSGETGSNAAFWLDATG